MQSVLKADQVSLVNEPFKLYTKQIELLSLENSSLKRTINSYVKAVGELGELNRQSDVKVLECSNVVRKLNRIADRAEILIGAMDSKNTYRIELAASELRNALLDSRA